MKTAWPKTVPVLTALDICKGVNDGARKTHCLLGWALKIFHDSTEPQRLLRREARRVGPFKSLVTFNDNPRRKLSTIARVWNRAMCKLGYVVGNPEAKKARRRG